MSWSRSLEDIVDVVGGGAGMEEIWDLFMWFLGEWLDMHGDHVICRCIHLQSREILAAV